MIPAAFKLSINGRAVDASEYAIASNPATEEAICQYPVASPSQLDEAVQAAKVAFTGWRVTPLQERQNLVAELDQRR